MQCLMCLLENEDIISLFQIVSLRTLREVWVITMICNILREFSSLGGWEFQTWMLRDFHDLLLQMTVFGYLMHNLPMRQQEL